MYAALEYFPFAEDLEGRMEEVKAFNSYLISLGVTTTYDVGYLDGSYDPVEAVYEAGRAFAQSLLRPALLGRDRTNCDSGRRVAGQGSPVSAGRLVRHVRYR